MRGALLKLLRWRLALLNGVSALSGYLLFPGSVEISHVLAAFAGTALLAAAGSAFNQVMERDLDQMMERTKGRPLPTGVMTVVTALGIGMTVMLGGMVWLAQVGGAAPMLIGAAALAWYLAVYTPLKRRTSMALPLGALCGALPPLIGWALAGGGLSDHRIMILVGVMFLWQIPHFWLLQRRHSADYRKVGIPLCEDKTGNSRTPLFILWIIALAVAAMLLPLFGIIPRQRVLLCAFFLLPLLLTPLLTSDRSRLVCLNLFPLLLTLAIWW